MGIFSGICLSIKYFIDKKDYIALVKSYYSSLVGSKRYNKKNPEKIGSGTMNGFALGERFRTKIPPIFFYI